MRLLDIGGKIDDTFHATSRLMKSSFRVPYRLDGTEKSQYMVKWDSSYEALSEMKNKKPKNEEKLLETTKLLDLNLKAYYTTIKENLPFTNQSTMADRIDRALRYYNYKKGSNNEN